MNNLPKARRELEDMIALIRQAERSQNDYKVIRTSVLYGNSTERKKWQKQFLATVFPKPPMKKKVNELSGIDLHIWLRKHLIEDRSSFVNVKVPPPINSCNYDEIFSLLVRDSKNIRSLTQKLLFKYCQYGAYLDKFYNLFCEKRDRNEISASFGVILRNEFNISDRHARRLRWLGRLWLEYHKIGFLSLTFADLLKREKEINDLFLNYPDLADEWKERNVDHPLVAVVSGRRV